MQIIRKKILAGIIRKEFIQVFRDKRMRVVLFVPPLMMLIIFGYAVNTDVNDIYIAVLDSDRTSISRSIIDRFTGSGYFRLHSYLDSEKEMVPLMDSGEIEVFIHIERGLSDRIRSGQESEIQIITDGTDSTRASVTVAYVNEIINSLFFEKYLARIRAALLKKQSVGAGPAQGIRLKQGITVKERIFFNPDLTSRNFFLPGMIGLLISLITIMLTAMSIVKERESGTIEQILVSPISSLEYILGKTIPYAIVGFIDICIISGVTIFWFRVPFNGSFVFLLFSGTLFIMSTLSVGLYISTISRTQQQAMLSFFLFFVPAILLSGFVFPVYSMPETIQALTWLNPMTYFFIIIRGVFLKGTGIVVLWPEMTALLIMGGILIFLSARRFSRRLE